jgi:hypothetical protein
MNENLTFKSNGLLRTKKIVDSRSRENKLRIFCVILLGNLKTVANEILSLSVAVFCRIMEINVSVYVFQAGIEE